MDWIDSKFQLPPLGLVIEGIGPKDWLYSKMGRDYFALVIINNELIWITPSLMDYQEMKDLKIKYWRFLIADPSGKVAYVNIKKYKNRTWEPKVIFKKE